MILKATNTLSFSLNKELEYWFPVKSHVKITIYSITIVVLKYCYMCNLSVKRSNNQNSLFYLIICFPILYLKK